MGKSTFIVNFFYRYIKKYNRQNVPFQIYVLYLGDPNVFNKIETISRIESPHKSILILDALDENIKAIKNPLTYFKELEEIIDEFKIVILTARTQLFSDEHSEPSIGAIPQSGELLRLNYYKIFISPFNNEEIQIYLGKKYKIPSYEYSRALTLTSKLNNLAERPLILSYLDDIISLKDAELHFTINIYRKIIDKWLLREIDKFRGDISIDRLYEFSKTWLKLYSLNGEKMDNIS